MPTLKTTVDGLKMKNPFVIGSGPPGTNVKVIKRAFKDGWGGVIAKTVSLDASKVVNVGPRYAKLKSSDGKEVIGWENIELISDRSFDKWLDEFKEIKDECPDGVLIASVMEEYRKDAWCEIIERCQAAGVDAFELNFSCPHGLPERQMGAAMGQDPLILTEVCGWVNEVSKLPGGYSSKAVKPIALRMVMEIAQLIRKDFPGRSLSAMGGVETGQDAAQFILLGGDTVQVCTGVMKFGYPVVQRMCEELLEFMESKGFETISDFKGHSLDYFTTHAELVRMQTERKAKEALAKAGVVVNDAEWDGDDFVKQSNDLAGN